jgi:predicted transglutaminase-like cysteine proteinase
LNGETAAARLATLKILQASCIAGALTATLFAASHQIAVSRPSVATPNARVTDAFSAIPLNVTRVLTNTSAALPAPVIEAKFDTRPSANAIVAAGFSAVAPNAVGPSGVTRSLRQGRMLQAYASLEAAPPENEARPRQDRPPAASATNDEGTAQLFSMDAEPVTEGALLDKWRRIEANIARDLEIIAQCKMGGRPCPGPAQKLIHLSLEGAGRSGRARVGMINRAVNRAISPVSDDTQWGVSDHWSGPFETLQSGRGDCEDYAILKYAALLETGVPKDDVKIVVLRNLFPKEDHAVAATRVNGEWLILDNRTLTLVRDTDATRMVPEFVLDAGGVRRFVWSSRNGKATSWADSGVNAFR